MTNSSRPGHQGLAWPGAALFFLLLPAIGSCAQAIDPREITLPAGFHIAVYAEQLEDARSLAISPAGTLFVGTRKEGKVYAVRDSDGDKRADRISVIAAGLNMPNGVAFRDGALYVAEVNRLLRYDDIETYLENPGRPVVVYDDLPTDAHHGWKYIGFRPDGLLYVPVGAPCNICDAGDPYAALHRMQPDGGSREIFARGIRNTVGFDWHPVTGQLWFTDNGRDWLGDDQPPDELNVVSAANLHFGYPYLHGREVRDPDFGSRGKDVAVTAPALEFPAHVAPLGVEFYSGAMFPEKYRNQLFVAQHGSWNRSSKTGYRIMAVFIDQDRVIGQQVFAEGWLQGNRVTGRPVDFAEMADGSLLVSDDHAGRIYRITYAGEKPEEKGERSTPGGRQ
jgi:glucose/arabinose dehydrogenase